MTRRLLPALLLVALAACHSGSGPKASPSPSSNRRTTNATIHVLEPKAGATVGSKVTVRLRVDGEPVLDPSDTTAPRGGHVHFYVDGVLTTMTKDLVLPLTLKAGSHTIRADFVAPDHQPFLNPVSATVVFTVRP